MPGTPRSVLALDVGSQRIGVSVASLASRLPRPLTTLIWNDAFFASLKNIIETEDIDAIVIGLPRGLDGQSTGQTKAVKDFSSELSKHCDLPIHFQDEAVTSKRAESELQARGKPYKRGDIDALAATYILEDFLAANHKAAA